MHFLCAVTNIASCIKKYNESTKLVKYYKLVSTSEPSNNSRIS